MNCNIKHRVGSKKTPNNLNVGENTVMDILLETGWKDCDVNS